MNQLMLIAGILAICAILGVLLLGIGGPEEKDSGGDLSPPPLPDGDQIPVATNKPPSGGDNSSILDVFGDSENIEPPSLPL